MKLKKKVPLIDQHDKFGFWGGKFGGSFIPETLKKPIEDLMLNLEQAEQLGKEGIEVKQTISDLKKKLEINFLIN